LLADAVLIMYTSISMTRLFNVQWNAKSNNYLMYIDINQA